MISQIIPYPHQTVGTVLSLVMLGRELWSPLESTVCDCHHATDYLDQYEVSVLAEMPGHRQHTLTSHVGDSAWVKIL